MDFTGIVNTVWGELQTLLNNILAFVVAGLPDSPFTFLNQTSAVAKFMPTINYFIPIGYMVSVLQAWVVAIAIFYVWQALLRWTKAIE